MQREALGPTGHRYRTDIDGLRSVAVLPVVLFHAGLELLSGGYVGVDVFFVISGYLITGIIWKEVTQDRFSIIRFYERRIRRIFPALLAMLAFVLVGASILYLPLDFADVPRSALAALGFVSNILFWSEAGYFAAPSASKPLLHTWSLAVEEQYYLLFPILMVVLYRYARAWAVAVLAALTLGSFVLSSIGVYTGAQSFTFFMAPTRVWELFVGSLLALGAFPAVANRTAREVLAALGLILIAVAVFAYSEETPFPGLAALLPVAGAALIIHSAEGTLVGRALSHKVPVFIGLISYSLYLWHWPIIVFANYYRIAPAGWADIAFVIAASFGMAWLSWRYVERPFRLPKERAGHVPASAIFRLAGTASLAVAGASAAAMAAGGWESRFDEETVRLARFASASSPRRNACHRSDLSMPLDRSCVYGAPVSPSVALWGDSHGVELVQGLGEVAARRNAAIRQITFSNCAPVVGFEQEKGGCREANEKVMAYLVARPEIRTVIWVAKLDIARNREAAFLRAARRTIETLERQEKRVILVYPVPVQPASVPQTLAKLHLRGKPLAAFGVPTEEFLRRNREVLALLDGIEGRGIVRVKPHELLCRSGGVCTAIADGKPLYFDNNHLSVDGARYVAQAFEGLIGRADPGPRALPLLQNPPVGRSAERIRRGCGANARRGKKLMNYVDPGAKSFGHVLEPYGRSKAARTGPGRLAVFAGIAIAAALYGALYTYFFPYRILQLTIPLVLLGGIVIWALPDAKTAPTRILAFLFFAFFIGTVLWPDYIAVALPGLPWITVRRIIAVPMVVALLICLSVSSQFRRDLREVLGAVPAVWKLMAAFAALQLLSIALSRDVGLSIDKFIVAQLYWTAIFFVGCYVFRTRGSASLWAALLCLMLIPLGLTGLLEWSNSRVPWAGRIPSFLVIEDENVQRILAGASRAASGIYRVQSTSTTSLGYAEYMALTTPFLIHFLLGPYQLLVRIAALIALPFTFFMIILTDSRLGVVGFFLSFLLYMLVWAALRWKRDRESLFGPAIVLAYPVIFSAFVTATFFIGRLRRMVWGGGEHQFSTASREEQYRMGLDILASNPLGYGIGMGAETLGFRNLAGALTIDTYYILIALEYGVIGFLIYYGMFLIATWKAGMSTFRQPAESREELLLIPLAIAISNFIVIKSIFSQDANHPVVFMMLAMMVALIWRRRNHDGAALETWPAPRTAGSGI